VIHLDTSFLVDLLREEARGRPGAAATLLERMEEDEIGVSVFVACELMSGAELSAHPQKERRNVERLLSILQVDYPDERFAPAYARQLAWQSRRQGRIATMDLLIATSAVVAGAPLVTRNARDFARVPDLEIVSY
jgi:tRNA(fMet)-specific endonuclease VapC